MLHHTSLDHRLPITDHRSPIEHYLRKASMDKRPAQEFSQAGGEKISANDVKLADMNVRILFDAQFTTEHNFNLF